MRYLNGAYHREDSRLIRSAKPWQLTQSWTAEQDMPSGRFRVIAYSPKKGVDWSVSWQETEQDASRYAKTRRLRTSTYSYPRSR